MCHGKKIMKLMVRLTARLVVTSLMDHLLLLVHLTKSFVLDLGCVYSLFNAYSTGAITASTS